MDRKYVVYRRSYRGYIGKSRPVGRTNNAERALSEAQTRNAHRRPNEWYGVEDSAGNPLYRPDDVRLIPCVSHTNGQE